MKGFNIATGRLPVIVIMATLALFGTSGCYEDYGLTVQDYDSYVTLYDQGTNFASFKYFIMPDTIVHLYDTSGRDPLTSARVYDRQILESTKGNLQGRGYVYLGTGPSAIPDSVDSNKVMLVRIGQFSSTYSGYYYDYWYGYYGGWYGWYYPYYPPTYVDTYEYTTGTTLTEIVDYGRSLSMGKVVPVWLASISGLVGVAGSNTSKRISDGINRTFEQSPYLYAGQ